MWVLLTVVRGKGPPGDCNVMSCLAAAAGGGGGCIVDVSEGVVRNDVWRGR